jgi:hypothetical protein
MRSLDPKYYIFRIQWQAAEWGAKAREPIINGRAQYRMHCYRDGSIHGAHLTEIAIHDSALQRLSCLWEGTTYGADASGVE